MLLFFSEWATLAVIICLGVFLFFDEEPLFDPTDWNIVHVVLITASLWIVVWENIVRSRYGQFVYKDQVLLFSTFTFWFALENYTRLIIIVFCFHCLTPLELELVELVEVFQTLMVWYTTDLLPTLLLMVILFGLSILLNFCINWYSVRAILLGVFIIVMLLTFNLLVLLWDFLFTSMSGCLFHPNPQQFYLHNRGTMGYNMTYQVTDAYDWHRAQPQSFVLRFEDLYLFYLQLFNIIALYSCTFVWLFLLQDLLVKVQSASRPSFTFLGVCTRWLDHALWCFVYSHLALFAVGLRVWLRTSIELLPWIF